MLYHTITKVCDKIDDAFSRKYTPDLHQLQTKVFNIRYPGGDKEYQTKKDKELHDLFTSEYNKTVKDRDTWSKQVIALLAQGAYPDGFVWDRSDPFEVEVTYLYVAYTHRLDDIARALLAAGAWPLKKKGGYPSVVSSTLYTTSPSESPELSRMIDLYISNFPALIKTYMENTRKNEEAFFFTFDFDTTMHAFDDEPWSNETHDIRYLVRRRWIVYLHKHTNIRSFEHAMIEAIYRMDVDLVRLFLTHIIDLKGKYKLRGAQQKMLKEGDKDGAEENNSCTIPDFAAKMHIRSQRMESEQICAAIQKQDLALRNFITNSFTGATRVVAHPYTIKYPALPFDNQIALDEQLQNKIEDILVQKHAVSDADIHAITALLESGAYPDSLLKDTHHLLIYVYKHNSMYNDDDGRLVKLLLQYGAHPHHEYHATQKQSVWLQIQEKKKNATYRTTELDEIVTWYYENSEANRHMYITSHEFDENGPLAFFTNDFMRIMQVYRDIHGSNYIFELRYTARFAWIYRYEYEPGSVPFDMNQRMRYQDDVDQETNETAIFQVIYQMDLKLLHVFLKQHVDLVTKRKLSKVTLAFISKKAKIQSENMSPLEFAFLLGNRSDPDAHHRAIDVYSAMDIFVKDTALEKSI